MGADKPGFFSELKRRNVLRAAVLYAGAVWLLAQVITQLGPLFDAPNWAMRAFVIACVIGFPFWVAFAWFYEFTPTGFKREREVAPGTSITHSTGRKLDFAIIGVLVIAVALLASGYFVQRKPTVSAVSAIPAQSIAVLPFENLSSDKQNNYFVAGMQDLILTKLADVGSLKVIARTSTEKYASQPPDLAAIGRQLGVATLLEGSVQKAGNAVLINVQLVKAADGSHIWAQSYQRTLDNVFGVEGEVAEKIATALNAKLSSQATRQFATALSKNPAANDLYLRAEYFANRGNIDFDTANWKQAIPLYLQAIQRAPDFALARAKLSVTESNLAWFGGGGEDVQQLNADARVQAQQALKLASDLPEAKLALGFCDYYGNGDYAAALTAFQAVLKLRPNDVGALAAQGYVLRRLGRFDAATVSLQQALARDPRNTVLTEALGRAYQLAGRYPEAEIAYRHALALDPANVQARLRMSQTLLLANGNIPAALAAATGDDPKLRQLRVGLLTYQRKYRDALALLDGIPDTPDNFNPHDGSKALLQADLYRLLGDTPTAQAIYEQALPQVRAGMPAAGGIAINEAAVWENIADAELGIGHTDKALAALASAQSLIEQARDQAYGPGMMEAGAALYAEAGRADLAVALLTRALASPGIGGYYSPVMLWLDPAWDPIRSSPQFQALLQKYAKDNPAVIPAAPAMGRNPAKPQGSEIADGGNHV